MAEPLSRRDALRLSLGSLAAGSIPASAADPPTPTPDAPPRPLLTPGKDFEDVSRGDPIPHTLTGDALAKARLTADTWRLEIVAEDKATLDKPLTLADGTALDLPTLLKLGAKRGVRFLKALQCNTIPRPLGQGLWEGVPLREVLKLCGKADARRLYYWGFHNDKPEQVFQSSLPMNQVLDTPPGELPPFVAYKLNGQPIPLERGGPVRMVVPWAHGFKSIKWLQRIALTDKYAANDTYATQGNDPESVLKTAAYFDDEADLAVAAGKAATVRGTCMVGWPGLERVEWWLRPAAGGNARLADDDPAWAAAEWSPAAVDPPPTDWGGGLPRGVLPKDVWGFDKDGKPKEWPMRYSIVHWTAKVGPLKAGKYELRVRTVDRNGYAQPQPRPNPRSGRNRVPVKLVEAA